MSRLPFSCAATDPARRSYLRPVEPEDAEFIVGLRTDEVLGRHLSTTAADIAAQAAWIERYMAREAEGLEYYFIIMHEGERVGTVRLYDFLSMPERAHDSFCWGSWIIRPPRPKGLATYSALMVYEVGFDMLNFRKSHFDVRKGNENVINFHLRHGAVQTGEDAENYYYDFPRAAYEAMKTQYAETIAEHAAMREPV